MALTKRIGYGTVIAFGDSSDGTSSSWTEVAYVKNATRGGGGANDVDETCLDSTSRFRDFQRGLVDGGTLDFTMAWDSTNTSHKKLGTLYRTGDRKWWFIQYPSTTTQPVQKFRGYVQNIGDEIPLDDLITQPVTIKVSGNPGLSST